MCFRQSKVWRNVLGKLRNRTNCWLRRHWRNVKPLGLPIRERNAELTKLLRSRSGGSPAGRRAALPASVRFEAGVQPGDTHKVVLLPLPFLYPQLLPNPLLLPVGDDPSESAYKVAYLAAYATRNQGLNITPDAADALRRALPFTSVVRPAIATINLSADGFAYRLDWFTNKLRVWSLVDGKLFAERSLPEGPPFGLPNQWNLTSTLSDAAGRYLLPDGNGVRIVDVRTGGNYGFLSGSSQRSGSQAARPQKNWYCCFQRRVKKLMYGPLQSIVSNPITRQRR